MVDVAPLFSGQDPRSDGDNAATLLAAARRACQVTWMCAAAPFGPNIHPNDAGYEAIAGAVEAKLGGPDW